MWILPAREATTPRYEQRAYPESERRGRLRLVVSPDGHEGSLTIGQDALLFAALIDGDETAELRLGADRCAWLHVARGALEINGSKLQAGDGAALVDEPELRLARGRDAELVVWDLPVI